VPADRDRAHSPTTEFAPLLRVVTTMRAVVDWLNSNQGVLAIVAILIAVGTIPQIGRIPKAIATSQAKRQRSRSYLSSYFERVALDLTKGLGGLTTSALRDYYVPVSVSAKLPPAALLDRSSPDRGAPITIPSLLAKGNQRRIVLLGEPGSGKTTVFANVALYMVDCWTIRRDVTAVPVPIRIKEWAVSGDSLYDYFVTIITAEQPDSRHRELPRDLSHRLKEGQFFFFLDGLDEIPERLYRDVTVKINEATANSPLKSCRFMVSCRTAIYQPSSIAADAVVEVRPFDNDDILDFLDRFDWPADSGQSGRQLFLYIQSNRQLLDSCRNPLRLKILVDLSRVGSDLPSNLFALYETFATQIVTRRWESLKLGEDPSSVSRIVQELCSRLALQRFTTVQDTTYTSVRVEDLAALLPAMDKDGNQPRSEAPTELASRILNHSGLFIRQAQNAYEFGHLSFQEYFAARELLNGPRTFGVPSDEQIDDLVYHLLDSRTKWLNVAMIFASGVTEPDPMERFITVAMANGLGNEGALSVGVVRRSVAERLRAEVMMSLLVELTHGISQVQAKIFSSVSSSGPRPIQDARGTPADLDLPFAALAMLARPEGQAWSVEAFEQLIQYVNEGDTEEREAAIMALARIRSERTVTILRDLLIRADTKRAVRLALERLGGDASEAVRDVLTTTTDSELAADCIAILEAVGGRAAFEGLAHTLYSPSPRIRLNAAVAICRRLGSELESLHLIAPPRNLLTDPELADTRTRIWPFGSGFDEPESSTIAKAAAEIVGAWKPFDAELMGLVDGVDPRVVVAIVLSQFAQDRSNGEDKTARKPRIETNAAEMIETRSMNMLEPSPFKLYLNIRGVFTKLGFDGAVEQWSALPHDWELLQRRSSRVWYRALQTIWLFLLRILPIVGALVLAVALVGRWFGASLFGDILGSWGTWTILLALIGAVGIYVLGVIFFNIILLRDYNPYGVGGSIMRVIMSQNKVSKWAVRIGLYIFALALAGVSCFLLSVSIAGFVGWLPAIILSAAIVAWQVAATRSSRDLVTGQRINRFSALVALRYLEGHQLKVAL
jgi:hypothetical protein